MYTFPTIIFILFKLSVAAATVSVDTVELCVDIANHHFSLFTLSVATATVSVDTIELVHIAKHHFSLLTLSVANVTVSVDAIELCVVGERSGSVVECLIRDRRAAGSSLTGITMLCP